MKTIYVRFLSAFSVLAGLAAAGRAQTVDQVNVNIPYEFVAAGKTLPAGTYRIRRVSDGDVAELSLTSFENRAGVLLVASEVSPASQGKPTLSFPYDGSQRILSKIETTDHIFTIPVSAKPAVQVAMKKQTTPATASGSAASGSN